MSKKNISFSSYDKIRKMTFNEFNRWVTGLYIDAFQEGQKEQQREEHNIFLRFAMGRFSKKKSDEKEEDK